MQKKLIWILTILSALITILLAAGEQPWPLIIAYWLVLTLKNALEHSERKDDYHGIH